MITVLPLSHVPALRTQAAGHCRTFPLAASRAWKAKTHSQTIVCHASQNGLRTPHSGYHWDGSDRRFFEGWYFKVTLPGRGLSFALIYSIEDPQGRSQTGALGAQIMGPDDSYLLQYAKPAPHFWASPTDLALGACFLPKTGATPASCAKSIVSEVEFDAAVEHGFQASTTWHQGSLVAQEGTAAGNLPSTVPAARWAMSVRPVAGWGDADGRQRATAGWLTALPVFEPHWQVLMAKGLATGWLQWGDQRFEFSEAPAYAEKNWGGGFPQKWFWVQCDAFEDASVTLTSIGARRSLPLGLEEDVGMIGAHWRGRLFEFVPWEGEVTWGVEPWGQWRVWARCGGYEALVEARCEGGGTPLRAPTPRDGLAPFCRDSFFGQVRLRIWEVRDGAVHGQPLVDTRSNRAAVEVGGGPWWGPWQAKARMREPLRSLVTLPIDVEGLSRVVPPAFRPRGL